MDDNPNFDQNEQQHTVIINHVHTDSNGIGTAGFVLAIIALLLGWVPGVGWIVWFLGLIFSFIGLFGKPKGLAVAGLVISCFTLIVLLVVAVGVVALLAAVCNL
jgi:hypothetical protein